MTAMLPGTMQTVLFDNFDDYAVNASENDECYTPPVFPDAAREVFQGDIALDPASCHKANETVRALWYYTKADNGLMQGWRGNVFCNPPYSKVNGASQAGIWFQKLVKEYEAARVRQGIFLCNVATGAEWFQPLFHWPLCFVEGRIAFLDKYSIPMTQPRYDNVFVYVGPHPDRFAKVFSQFGAIK